MTISVRAFYHDKKYLRIAMYMLWALEQLITVAAAGLSLKFGQMETAACAFVTGPLMSLPYWWVKFAMLPAAG